MTRPGCVCGQAGPYPMPCPVHHPIGSPPMRPRDLAELAAQLEAALDKLAAGGAA